MNLHRIPCHADQPQADTPDAQPPERHATGGADATGGSEIR
jgi:hypothetical protein